MVHPHHIPEPPVYAGRTGGRGYIPGPAEEERSRTGCVTRGLFGTAIFALLAALTCYGTSCRIDAQTEKALRAGNQTLAESLHKEADQTERQGDFCLVGSGIAGAAGAGAVIIRSLRRRRR